MIGSNGADVLIGLGGNDRLDGRRGADLMQGGTGDDSYFVDNPGDRVIERAGEGHDSVFSWVSFTLGGQAIEDLSLMGSAALSGTGNALANTITGNLAANRLDGGGGRDVLIGGRGDDLYIVRDSGDRTVERPGQGLDTIWAFVTWTLQAETERLMIKGLGTLDGTGNGLSNHLVGNGQDNRLNGKGGVDFLRGNGGADVFVFDQKPGAAHADRIKDFTSGTDRIALQADVFGLASGGLKAAQFARHDGPQTAQTRVIYNEKTGWLSYDPDGTGGAAALPFARLAGTPDLVFSDIFAF